MTAIHKYLHKIIDYGGEPCTRAEAILHMQSIGMDQPCIDRWLQGQELAQRLRKRSEHITTRLFLAPPRTALRPRRLAR